jgi:hypothetical protein
LGRRIRQAELQHRAAFGRCTPSRDTTLIAKVLHRAFRFRPVKPDAAACDARLAARAGNRHHGSLDANAKLLLCDLGGFGSM